MMAGLGSAWVSDTLAFKRYPGCAYIDTTLDALFEILAELSGPSRAASSRPTTSHRVSVEANLLTVEMDNLSSEHDRAGEPLSPINVNFSIPFNVAHRHRRGRPRRKYPVTETFLANTTG